jgi:hypothetical protein
MRVGHRLWAMLVAALFVVVLDESSPSSFDSSSESLLLGKSGARWFDKHQLIVFKNGVAGANLEHAPADGTAALRLLAHATEYAKQCELSNATDSCKCPQPGAGTPSVSCCGRASAGVCTPSLITCWFIVEVVRIQPWECAKSCIGGCRKAPPSVV